jgi:hypothetical protein
MTFAIKISSCLPAGTKAATAGSELPRNGAAVERAERKGVAQARIEFQADERCAVELLSSIVTLDRALPPDRRTGQRRGDTAAREHGHVSGRQLCGDRNGLVGFRRQSQKRCKASAVEEQRGMLDHWIDGDDEPMRPLWARHRRGIKRHEGERMSQPAGFLLPVTDELLSYTPLPPDAHRRAVRRLDGDGAVVAEEVSFGIDRSGT